MGGKRYVENLCMYAALFRLCSGIVTQTARRRGSNHSHAVVRVKDAQKRVLVDPCKRQQPSQSSPAYSPSITLACGSSIRGPRRLTVSIPGRQGTPTKDRIPWDPGSSPRIVSQLLA